MQPTASIELSEQAMDTAFNPQQEHLLAVGLVNGKLQLFQCSDQESAERLSLEAHTLSCRAVTFTSTGNMLLSGSADKSVLVYDLAKQKTVGRIPDAHPTEITRLCSVNESTFASGDEAGATKTWDLRQRKPAQQFTHHTDYISDLAAHPRHPCLLATSADGSLSVTDLRKQQVRGQSDGDPDDGLESLVVLKGGRKVVCGSMSGIISVFDWGKLGDPSGQFPGHPSSVDAMVKLDEDSVVTGSGDGVLRALSVLPNKFLGVIGEDPQGGCDRLAISHDSKLLASTSYGASVRLWNLEEEEEERHVVRQEEKDASSSDEEGRRGARRRPKQKQKKGRAADSRAEFFKDLL